MKSILLLLPSEVKVHVVWELFFIVNVWIITLRLFLWSFEMHVLWVLISYHNYCMHVCAE